MGIVLYSSFFPDEKEIFRGVDFLNQMYFFFKNYKICIGIQLDSCDKWVEIIEEYISKGLNIKYDFCEKDLYVNSDVSGYQKAIEVFHKNFLNTSCFSPFVWFGHSKGVTTKKTVYHDFSLKSFWSKREEIEERLSSQKNKGCFGHHLSYIPNYDEKNISQIWKKYSNFVQLKKPLNYMLTNTFYVVKYEIFYEMISKINSTFFNEKIEGISGSGDRYFFERDFIHFVDMMGFEPDYNFIVPNITWSANNIDYKKNLEEWKKN